ncbi:MAG: HPP family protein [Nannocystaceae bacterium]
MKEGREDRRNESGEYNLVPFVTFHGGIARPYELPPPPGIQEQAKVANASPLRASDRAGDEIPAALRRYNAQSRQSREAEKKTLRSMVARDIMTSPVQSLPEDASVAAARGLFRLRKFRYVPVVSPETHPIGMLTDRDTFLLSDVNRGLVRDVMRRDVITTTPDTSVQDLLRVMVHAELGALPVTETDEVLVGIITTSDVLRAIADADSLDLWA